jgi:hypothetical protein
MHQLALIYYYFLFVFKMYICKIVFKYISIIQLFFVKNNNNNTLSISISFYINN